MANISFCSAFAEDFSFRGKTATEFLEWLTPSSLSSLKPFSSTLSVLLRENGGIIDDTVVTKHSSDVFYVVTNAGCRDKVLSWFETKLDKWNTFGQGKEGPVKHEILEDWGLVALQGLNLYLSIVSMNPTKFYNRSRSSILPTELDFF